MLDDLSGGEIVDALAGGASLPSPPVPRAMPIRDDASAAAHAARDEMIIHLHGSESLL
jgi:hypothetical protein